MVKNQLIQQGGHLGRYQLITRLATGGMAEVWLARATGAKGFQKTIVVKTILPHLADDPDFLRMFINEALLAAALNHPNVVQIFDLGQIGEHYFIAMEYILGRTMRQVQRVLRKQRKVMPVWLVLKVAVSVCDALDYAHNKRGDDGDLLGIVHRDVTPENIMISFSGVTKVVDFGIAKATTGAIMTQAGKIKGKLAYLAPEQIVAAGSAPVDRRTDIYAMGVLLYEMLTGVRPFRAPNDMALLLKIPKEMPTPPSQIARWVPTRLSDIVMKAMAKEPTDRYQEAGGLGEDLQGFLTSIDTYPTERHVSAYMCKLFPEEERQVPILAPGTLLARSKSAGDSSVESASGVDIKGPDSAGSISIDISFEEALAGAATTASVAAPTSSYEEDIDPSEELTAPVQQKEEVDTQTELQVPTAKASAKAPRVTPPPVPADSEKSPKSKRKESLTQPASPAAVMEQKQGQRDSSLPKRDSAIGKPTQKSASEEGESSRREEERRLGQEKSQGVQGAKRSSKSASDEFSMPLLDDALADAPNIDIEGPAVGKTVGDAAPKKVATSPAPEISLDKSKEDDDIVSSTLTPSSPPNTTDSTGDEIRFNPFLQLIIAKNFPLPPLLLRRRAAPNPSPCPRHRKRCRRAERSKKTAAAKSASEDMSTSESGSPWSARPSRSIAWDAFVQRVSASSDDEDGEDRSQSDDEQALVDDVAESIAKFIKRIGDERAPLGGDRPESGGRGTRIGAL